MLAIAKLGIHQQILKREGSEMLQAKSRGMASRWSGGGAIFVTVVIFQSSSQHGNQSVLLSTPF